MVNVQPFRGLRYEPDVVGDWGSVLGPPYDIVSVEQTASLKASSPYQIAHIETAAGDEIPEAAELLRQWRASGAVVQDASASYYVHEHFFDDALGSVRRAIFGAVELTSWGEGVMAHERTMPGPKATRTALRSVVGADVSPLMAFAPDVDGALAEAIATAVESGPLHEGTDPTGERHTLRRVDDAASVGAITEAFGRQRIYMADGHHRYESALASIDERAASGRVLMGIVPAGDPALVVGATHRVVHAPAPASLLAQLGRFFRIEEMASGRLEGALEAGSSSLGLVTRDGSWLLSPTEAAESALPSDVPTAWRRLAPAVLQYVVLEPILGIGADELAGGQAVTYTHHAAEVVSSVAGGASAGFVLPAPTLQDVIDTADAGGFMPQKSTYFVPKLPTGLVLHPLE